MKSLTCPIISTDSEVDYRKAIRYTFAKGRGANIIFSLGTTGEADYLFLKDKKNLIAIAVDEVGQLRKKFQHNSGRTLELAVGITGRDIDETAELAQYAEQKDADYAVLMPVSITMRKGDYSRKIGPNVRTILNKTKKIKLILYNFPLITGNKNIKTGTWKYFARNPRIVGLKDSSGDRKRAENYIKAAAGNAEVDIGSEILGLKMDTGRIVAGSTNILPVPWNMATFGNRYENDMVARTAEKLVEFQKIYAEDPIGAFKHILFRLGIISSKRMFNEDLTVSSGFARRLNTLLKDKDFQIMHQACLA